MKISKAPSTIAGVAAIANGCLISLPRPYRHHHVLAVFYHRYNKALENIQGFVTDTGEFLDRKQALLLAEKSGQLLAEEPIYGGQLYSENLWRDRDPETAVEELVSLATVVEKLQ